MLSERLFLLASTVALASAQTTASASGPVVSLFIPDADIQTLVASVVGASGPTTTYAVTCPDGTDPNDCGFYPAITITEGSGTFAYTESMPDFTASVNCAWSGTTSGICTESFGGPAANFPGLSTTTLSSGDIKFMPITVTAGLQASAATGAAATGSAAGSSPSGTATSTGTGSESATGTATTAAAMTTTTSSNAAGMALVQSEGLFGLAFLGLVMVL